MTNLINKTSRSKIELLAPVGNWEMLYSVINAGCDAIYFGIKNINMRNNSKNFTISDLKKISKICHENNVKAYLTLNTIIYEKEENKIKQIISKVKQAEIDAIICWDFSVIQEAKRQNVEFHISTQASVSNFDSAKFYSDLGAKRIVFARELTLKEIKQIRSKIKKEKLDLDIEVFGHGAMCVSESGRCFMSEMIYGKSANRGDCIQPCRRSYIVTDKETNKELEVDNHYVLSPKDLCVLPFLDVLYPYIDSLKIEGRGRSPEYGKVVIECYREAINAIESKSFTDELKVRLIEKIKTVYNRGFSTGFYMNRPIGDFTDAYGSKATMKKTYVGYVDNHYKKANAFEVKIESDKLKLGDTILIMGPTTGVLELKVESMKIKNSFVRLAKKGDLVGIKFDKLVRKNDKVYTWEKVDLL
jgi:putative protease